MESRGQSIRIRADECHGIAAEQKQYEGKFLARNARVITYCVPFVQIL